MNDSNTKSLVCPVIAGISITTDEKGRFNLNALHKASGLNSNKAPSQWLRTQTAQELVEELTDVQKCTSPINSIKGGLNQGTYAHELLAVSYAGWISPKFQLMVNQVFLDYKSGKLKPKAKQDKSYLPEFRKARAIAMCTKTSEIICSRFPHLSQASQQAVFANLINPIAGDVIPLPVLEEPTYSATEAAKMFNTTPNKIGIIANRLGLKTPKYGHFVLDKSRHSSKQVETFRYNQKGIEALSIELSNSH